MADQLGTANQHVIATTRSNELLCNSQGIDKTWAASCQGEDTYIFHAWRVWYLRRYRWSEIVRVKCGSDDQSQISSLDSSQLKSIPRGLDSHLREILFV